MMSLMLAPSLFRYFLRTFLYSSRLADGRFDFFGLLYLPGAVGEKGLGRRRGDLDLLRCCC